jgi:hypothetical protein
VSLAATTDVRSPGVHARERGGENPRMSADDGTWYELYPNRNPPIDESAERYRTLAEAKAFAGQMRLEQPDLKCVAIMEVASLDGEASTPREVGRVWAYSQPRRSGGRMTHAQAFDAGSSCS